jgi:hypothetical protein
MGSETDIPNGTETYFLSSYEYQRRYPQKGLTLKLYQENLKELNPDAGEK